MVVEGSVYAPRVDPPNTCPVCLMCGMVVGWWGHGRPPLFISVVTILWAEEGSGVMAHPSFIMCTLWGGGIGGLPPPFFDFFFGLYNKHCFFFNFQFWTEGVFLNRQQFFPESSWSWLDYVYRKRPNFVFVKPPQSSKIQPNFDCLYLLHPDSD